MAIILLYHRIAQLQLDPWLLCVTPQHFREHLEVLKRDYCPQRLDALHSATLGEGFHSPTVAITFDDGYADNLYQAKPQLEHFEIPATFFVTTGCLGREREFWWDELENILLQAGVLPQKLQLIIDERVVDWNLGAAAAYQAEEYQRHLNWHAWEEAPTPRHALYYALWQVLHPLLPEQRKDVFDQIRVWAGVEGKARSTHKTLSIEEMREVSRDGLIEVGSHTQTHSRLSSLPKEMQWEEIYQSKVDLEAILGDTVMSFAYPFGKEGDYSPDAIALVQGAGFTRACVNIEGLVFSSTDPFQLPRFHVEDCDGEQFSRRLEHWTQAR